MTRDHNGIWTLTDHEMNRLACWAQTAGHKFAHDKLKKLEDKARTDADCIFNILETVGYYKGKC